MKPRNLRQVLLLATAILIIITGLSITVLFTQRYTSIQMENAIAKAENLAHGLALNSVDYILVNDLVTVQKILDDQITSNPNVSYLFIVKDSQVLTHTFKNGIPIGLIAANKLNNENEGHLEQIVSEKGERFIDVAWPIFSGKGGVLRLGVSEKAYRQQVFQLWMQMSLITLGILVIVLIAVHLLISRITRPLLSLADAVEKIDEEHLETNLSIGGSREVNILRNSFNKMLNRLNEFTYKLKLSNEKLEKKNFELDRAHKQLRTSFDLSVKISTMGTLLDICQYLIKTFKEIVACQHIVFLTFDSKKSELSFYSEKHHSKMDDYSSKTANDVFSLVEKSCFIDSNKLNEITLPAEFSSTKQSAVFPLYENGINLGYMLIACPGKCNCVNKEWDLLNYLLIQTTGAIKRAIQQEEEIKNLRKQVEVNAEFSGIIGKDPKMQQVFKLIKDVAPTDSTVLIQGESGTGKELIAQAIHDQSLRKEHKFVVINCSAYPSELLESELFGYEKGAFTGAVRQRVGRFEQADGGTVFLDEIGEISQSAQIKLLRVLQSHKFERVGGNNTITVDSRVLAATNRNLLERVKSGHFREDLYYRLNVIPIDLPPLRLRKNDIPILANHFLKRYSALQGKNITGFSSESMRLLLNYHWPGNVRELENSIEHSTVLAKGDRIETTDFPVQVIEFEGGSPVSFQKTIAENEVNLLTEVLNECEWNKTVAASRLGISRSTLYEKLKKHGITKSSLH